MVQTNEELLKLIKELREKNAWDPITKYDLQKIQPTLTYAWNWFSYHANQRLTAFNYFLIIVGFLVAGYITCVDKQLYWMQVVLGFVGVLISMAFLALDFRNEELVNDGRDALRKLEQALNMGIGLHTVDHVRDETLVSLGALLFDSRAPSCLVRIKHSVWLRRIERLALVLFFCALVLGASSWISEGRPVGLTQPKAIKMVND